MRRALLAVLASVLLAPAARADDGPPSDPQRAFLLGRPDAVPLPSGDGPDSDLLAVTAVRDLWWRPAPWSAAARARLEVTARETEGVVGERLVWLLDRPDLPYPVPADSQDPHPVLTALVRDREWRESRGRVGLLDEGPLRLLGKDLLVRDPGRGEWVAWFLTEFLRPALEGPDAGLEPAARIRFESTRTRSRTAALLAVLSFLAACLLAGRRAGTRAGRVP